MSEFYSCTMIAGFQLAFEGRIDAERCISMCCEKHVPNIPSVGFLDTPEETLERFLGMRTLAAAECMDKPANPSYGCAQCSFFQKAVWSMKPHIASVNLSMYPAPCQGKCLYCCEAEHLNQPFTPEVKAAYEKLFDFLEYAKKRGIIEPKAKWQVSSGEITLHPYKDRFLELVRDRHATFYTNAFLFDAAIAQKLHDDPDSAINLSIDAGTPETWHTVKGFDNFDTVVSNLRRYSENSARPGQIILKYIILPDVNDNPEDFRGVVELARELGVRRLNISRDTEKKYDSVGEYREKLLEAAARLLALCKSSGITNGLFSYSAQEQAELGKRAEKLFGKGGNAALRLPDRRADSSGGRADALRRDLDRAKKEADSLRHELEQQKKRADTLQSDLAKQKKRADALQYDLDLVHDSVSFRVGRGITWLPRKLRDAAAVDEKTDSDK